MECQLVTLHIVLQMSAGLCLAIMRNYNMALVLTTAIAAESVRLCRDTSYVSGYVKNVPETSKQKSPCGSWIKYWEKVTRRKAPRACPICNCSNPVEDGVHLYLVNERGDNIDDGVYIIPLCRSHNRGDEPMRVVNGTLAARINIELSKKYEENP
jgi:hypothetical protein